VLYRRFPSELFGSLPPSSQPPCHALHKLTADTETVVLDLRSCSLFSSAPLSPRLLPLRRCLSPRFRLNSFAKSSNLPFLLPSTLRLTKIVRPLSSLFVSSHADSFQSLNLCSSKSSGLNRLKNSMSLSTRWLQQHGAVLHILWRFKIGLGNGSPRIKWKGSFVKTADFENS